LGGINVGHITLIATEDGVGVKTPPNMTANINNISVTSAGDINIDQSCLNARAIDLRGKNIEVGKGSRVFANTLKITGGNLSNKGLLFVSATGGINTNLKGKLDNYGMMYTSGDMNLKATKKITNRGKIISFKDININGKSTITNYNTDQIPAIIQQVCYYN